MGNDLNTYAGSMAYEKTTDPWFISKVTDRGWADEAHATVRCKVTFPNHPWGMTKPMDYLSVSDDVVPHAIQLNKDLVAGKYGPIDTYVGPDDEALAVIARQQRDRLLRDSDWSQLPDVPVATQQAFVAYRDALRSLPTQHAFPKTIAWPVKPQ